MKDGWTVKTKDRSLSAQYEHTIVVTDNGCEILTLRKDDTIPAIISHDEQMKPANAGFFNAII